MTKPSDLSDEAVRAIRASAEDVGVLAERYGMRPAMVTRVRARQIRKDVTDPPTEDETRMSTEDETRVASATTTPAGADLSIADRDALRISLAAKLATMAPSIIVHPDWDIETLQTKIEKIQKEQLGRELADLGRSSDPTWSIERFQEEIEIARVPLNAPPGIDLVQVGVEPEDGGCVKVQCITEKVLHLGDGQTMRKMQKALVTPDLADRLVRDEKCVRLDG